MDTAAEHYVPIYVPERLFAPVLSHVASLLARDESAGDESEWTDEMLKRLYYDSESLEQLLLTLAARPGDWLTTDDLAAAIGQDANWRSVAALLASLTRRRKSYGLSNPPYRLRTDPKTGKYSYQMSSDTAARILAIHKDFVEAIKDAPEIEL